MTHQHVVILGAGPCGLGAAWRLQERGNTSFHVYEASDHVGGLSASFVDAQGFTWDIGGHVFHAHDARMQQLFLRLLGKKYCSYTRHAAILVEDTIVSYPFQYHLHMLPSSIREECLAGIAHRQSGKKPTSFYDWILHNFGAGMAKYFFFPYNKKMWGHALQRMDWHWIGDKVATTNEQEKGNTWGRNATFFVPAFGGIGAVWVVMAQLLRQHITLRMRAVSVDAKQHIVTFQDGSRVQYDYLLSTMPISSLVGMISDKTFPSVSRLSSCGVYVVGLGMRGLVPEQYRQLHWMYIPSSLVPFFRLSVYSNYGKRNAPQGTWSLLFEVSYDGKKSLDAEQCIRGVITKAKAYRYIPKDAEIIDTFFYAAPDAYPVPTKQRDAIVSRVRSVLVKHSIYSLGRFGSWKYEEGNMDQVCLAGMEWADTINIT